MVRRRLAFAIFAACATIAASPVLAGPRALLELFTSQGCSSCPPADRLLGELMADPSLIAMSLPIDVWDYLGWKDTLADPRNTARWQGYAHARGDRERYTPQMVVNGTAHALGSDIGAIEQAITKSRTNAAVMSVDVQAERDGDRLVVTLPPGGPTTSGAVSVWALAKAMTVAITRGENKGHTVTYHNVMRRLVRLGSWSAATRRWSIPVRELAGQGIENAAVMLQAGTAERPGVILGAAMARVR